MEVGPLGLVMSLETGKWVWRPGGGVRRRRRRNFLIGESIGQTSQTQKLAILGLKCPLRSQIILIHPKSFFSKPEIILLKPEIGLSRLGDGGTGFVWSKTISFIIRPKNEYIHERVTVVEIKSALGPVLIINCYLTTFSLVRISFHT